MAFVGSRNLEALLTESEIIFPYSETNIKNGAYELCLGSQVFQTGIKPRALKNLKEKEEIFIEPGQFALLLTEEKVKIPKDKIAFISIKAGIKFEGLVNVSGFHVDPGFEGKLLFSVYNAGPSTIVLRRGTRYFPMWFAEMNEEQDYIGEHKNQDIIPIDPIKALSQGELASPNELSKRIDDVKQFKTKVEWGTLAIVTLLVGVSIKLWLDVGKLRDAIDFGYNNKTEELKLDSIRNDMKLTINSLNTKVDSLSNVLKKNEIKKK
jgi:dCTP deaminase